MLQQRKSRTVAKQLDVIGPEKLGNSEKQSDLCVLENVRCFRSLKPSVERNKNSCAAVNCARCNDPLGGVLRPDGNTIAWVDSDGDQSPSCYIRAIEKFAPVQTHFAVDKSLEFGKIDRGAFEGRCNG